MPILFRPRSPKLGKMRQKPTVGIRLVCLGLGEMAHLLSSRIEEIFRFGTIGPATAGVFYGLVAGGSLFSIESVWMTSVAYVAAITFQYFGHTLFTFRADVKSKRQIYRFLVVNFFGWVFSAVTVNWLGPLYGLGWER